MTTFTIELDTGLSHLLQSALRLANDRSRDTHRRERSKRSYGHCRRRTEIPESERGAPPVYGKHPTSTTLSNAFRSAPRLMSGPRLSVGPSPGPVAPLSSIGLLSAIQELVKPQIALNAASGKQHRGPAFAPPKLPRRFKQNLNDLVRVGPVGLEPTTYGATGVHRLPRVTPVAKRALPGSEQATCGQLGRLRDSIVAPERRVTSRKREVHRCRRLACDVRRRVPRSVGDGPRAARLGSDSRLLGKTSAGTSIGPVDCWAHPAGARSCPLPRSVRSASAPKRSSVPRQTSWCLINMRQDERA